MSSARKAFVTRKSTCAASTARIDFHGEYRELRPFVEEIKRAREPARLTLAEMSRRCGIDKRALPRLENSHNKIPTLDTLWRYVEAVGRRLVLSTEAIRDTGPARGKAKRVREAPER
jgi:transcriptional regulator with XRE-family HTH domain